MSKEELIIEHNEMVTKLLNEVQNLYNHRYYSSDIAIEKFYNKAINIINYYIEQPEWKTEKNIV